MRRDADAVLLDCIAAERFASVLAPRASGKSSLMGRAIRRLRADGQTAAVIDLAQISTRGDGVDSARWHYGIAYRICRELRLKVDLQAWWQERNLLLNDQRLVEFFWDIVLDHTSGPVTIFFDEVERIVDLPFCGELFSAIHSTYLRRVSEPDFSRLNFVVLGVATATQLCPDISFSPFAAGQAVVLEDFSLEECYAFAEGIPAAEPVSRMLVESVYAWTHGQPYLTQKLSRAVARRRAAVDDVDSIAHELFLAPGISREEPYLSQIRQMLTDASTRGRQAQSMLARLARGGELIDDPGSAAQSVLRLGGFVSSDENGMLRFRNRLIERTFGSTAGASAASLSRWQRWRRPAAIGATAAIALVLLINWYTRILPRPYIDTLTLVNADFLLAEQAYDRLRRLPGFGGRADGLFADVMRRRSLEAESIADARAADAVLRERLGRASLADRLIADFWLRQSENAVRYGERDVALVYALAAAESGSAAAGERALNLIDGDYRELVKTIRFERELTDFAVDWDRNQLVGLDQAEQLYRLALASTETGDVPAADRLPPPMRLTALQQIGVTRGLFVDEPGRAGIFELTLSVDHSRPEDLLLRLRAPSGAMVEVGLPRRDGGLEQFTLTATRANGLARLAEESMTGRWELTVFDRLSGRSGRLLSWSLRFPGVPQLWEDELAEGIDLPDPVETEQVSVTLRGDGRRAVAIPSRNDVRGAATLWDLETGATVSNLPLADRADQFFFIGADRLLIAGPFRSGLWRIDDPGLIGEFVADSVYALPPAVSPTGNFFAIAETRRQNLRVTVVAVDNGAVIGQFDAEPWQHWVLAENARYLAVTAGDRRGRLIDPVSGETSAEFFHDHSLVRLIAAPEQIVAIDDQGAILAWPLEAGRQTLTPRESVRLGTTTDSASVDLSADGSWLSYAAAGGVFSVSRVPGGARRGVLDHGNARVLGSRLAPDASRLVSAAGDSLRVWQLQSDEPQDRSFGQLSALAVGGSGNTAVLGHRSGRVDLFGDLAGAMAGAVSASADNVGHLTAVTSIVLDSRAERAASGGSDGLVRIWDLATQAPSPYLIRHSSGPIHALAFSPDGRWLASAGPDSARVFEIQTRRLVNEIEVDGDALAVAFSPDSRRIAVGDSAGNIYLASPDPVQGVTTSRGRAAVTALEFSSSPDLLASGASDGSLVLWNTLDGRIAETVSPFQSAVDWIRFLPDDSGLELVSGPWVFRLRRDDSGLQVADARLLPAELRIAPALASIGDGRIQILADAGGGGLVLDEFSLNSELSGDLEAQSTEIEALESSLEKLSRSSWSQSLGLELDQETGLVRPVVAP